MYTDYFRLREEPFSITPDPRYLFLTAQHREALNHLLYGIRERKGFISLTGEVGAGKTTLCRALLNELGPRYHTALVLNPLLSNTQLMVAVLEEFALHIEETDDKMGYLRLLNKFLLRVNSAGDDAVLIIDEAQDMPIKAMEMVRLLGNLETERQKLLQIVLVGQPELARRLSRPSLRQLAQRITVRFHLTAMSAHDTEDYIRHRLQVAGAPQEGNCILKFDRGAIREIYRYSRGTPRLVNAVGDKALLAGYVYRTGQIDRNLIRLAIAELKEAG